MLLLATPLLFFPDLLAYSAICSMGILAVIWIVRRVVATMPLLPLVPVRIVWLVMLFVTMVGVLVSADPTLTFPKLTGLFLAFGWWRLLTITTTQRLLPLFIIGFLTFSLLIVAMGVLTVNWADKVGFVQAIINQLPNQLVALPGSSESGVSGNQLAGTLLLFWALPIALAANWRNQSLGISLAALVITVSMGILLLATQSRSGWLGGIALVGTFALTTFFTTTLRAVRLTIGFAFVLLAMGTILLATQLESTMLTRLWAEPPRDTAIGNLGTLAFRQEVWQWAIVAIGDFPFTGTGLGTFRAVVHRLYPIAIPVTYDIAHAHNMFLQVALDIGLIGLIAYLAILWNAGWMCLQLMKRDPLQKALGQGFLVSMVGFHVYGLGDALALGSKTHIIFWMLLGIVTGAFVNCRDLETGSATILEQDGMVVVSSNL